MNYAGLPSSPWHERRRSTPRRVPAPCWRSRSRAASRPASASSRRSSCTATWPTSATCAVLVIHPASTTHSQLSRGGAAGDRRHARAGPARGRDRAHRRHPGRPRGRFRGAPRAPDDRAAIRVDPRVVPARATRRGQRGGTGSRDRYRSVTPVAGTGRRRYLEIGDLRTERGATLPDVTVAYETWGTLNPVRDNAVLVLHALTGDCPRGRPGGSGPPDAGLVGRADRPGRAARHRPLVRRRDQRARRLSGHHRPVAVGPGRPPVRLAASRPSPIRDQVAAEVRVGRRARHRLVRGRPRRLDGRHARPGVGRRRSRTGSAARSSWPPRRRPPPTRSPGPHRRSPRSGSTPTSRGGDYYDGPAPLRRAGGGARRSRTSPTGQPVELAERFGRDAQGGEDLATRRPVRRRVLPGPPRRQARPAASTRTPTWS